MEPSIANCPKWLAELLTQSGGSVSFCQFMDWALNEKSNGAYATGRLKIGKEGDFVTSPSLGSDFAELLAVQIIHWFEQLDKENNYSSPLCLIDIGPGEGHLSRDLIIEIEKTSPHLLKRIELILVEVNEGMIIRQKENLKDLSIKKIMWKSIYKLAESPVEGIILAHEIFDSIPVERLSYKNNKLYRQGIKLIEKDRQQYIQYIELPLTKELSESIDEVCMAMNFVLPPPGIKEGWNTEWHSYLNSLLLDLNRILKRGILLVVDYTLESFRYYNSSRKAGTIIAYKQNNISFNVLKEPGLWDLTSHLCLETLNFYAEKNNWNSLGHVRQGEALLALGLASKIHSLKYFSSKDLSVALEKRECLLRLVDPNCLGGFYWMVFQKNNDINSGTNHLKLETKCLNEPL